MKDDQYIDYIEREKMKAAFEFTARFDELNMVAARTYLKDNKIDQSIDYGNEKCTPEEFHTKILANEDVYNKMKKLLGMCEDLSLAIQLDYANEEILNRSLVNIVCWAYEQFQPYIYVERENEGHQGLYSELEDLYTAWRQGTSLRESSRKDLLAKKAFSPWQPSDSKSKPSEKNPLK